MWCGRVVGLGVFYFSGVLLSFLVFYLSEERRIWCDGHVFGVV